MEHANHVEPGPWTTKILQWSDRHHRALFALVVVLYAASFNGQWRVGPDSAGFAAIARSVAEGQGFQHPVGFEGHVSPGLIYMLAASFRLLGNDTFWPVLVIFFLLAMATLVLVYRTFLLHTDRPTAALVTMMVAESSLFIRYTFDMLNTIPFLFGVMLLIWSHERQKQRVGAPLANYAIMVLSFVWMAAFRIVFINVLAAWLLVMFVQAMRSPRRWRTLSVIAATVLALVVLRFIVDPRAREGHLLPREQEIVNRLTNLPGAIRTVLPANAKVLLLGEGSIAALGNPVGIPVVDAFITIAAIGAMIALGRRRLLWGVLSVLFVTQWLLFFADARYFVALLPLLAYGWWRLWTGIERRWPSRATGMLMLLMTGLWPMMNIPRSVGFMIEQRRVPFLETYRGGQYLLVREFSLAIMEQTDRDCWIIGPLDMSSAIGYWSRRRVYPALHQHLPSKLTGQGYIILPLDEHQEAQLKNRARGWHIGPSVISLPAPEGSTAWHLHELRIESARAAGTRSPP